VSDLGRHGLRLLALGLLLLGGLGSALLASGSFAAVSRTATGTTAGQTTTSGAGSVLVVSGHGWGHGLGMAQWGAYGYAKHGWTYDRILAHYYVGTTLGPPPVSTVRVLLASGKSATLAARGPWSVTDAAGTTVQLDPTEPLVVAPDFIVSGQTLVPPLTFRSAQPLVVDKQAYRGRLVVSVAGQLLQVVDVVGLQAYVKGVVPAEMPSNWPVEALKAQAVATRSYALANLAHARSFDLYADSRSQVYGGVEAESPASSAAVDATKGQVVVYAGKVADTLFSSSSGGRTASALETTGIGVPYLVSVADPYDTVSPYHDWGPVLLDLTKVAKLLKVPAPLDDLQITPGASGRVRSAVVLSDDTSEAKFTGNQLRTVLGLRSTWFSAELLRLVAPTAPMAYGGAATLGGFARGTSQPVSLESKPTGGAWTPVGNLVLDADGTFSTIVQPELTTQYRLVSGPVHAAVAKVGVAPRIELQGSTAGVDGTLSPPLASVPVELQRQDASVWTTVASTQTDDAGAWSFGGGLTPGTYRVRTAAGHGYVMGASKPLQIS
jgi:stage II sporulation protein D